MLHGRGLGREAGATIEAKIGMRRTNLRAIGAGQMSFGMPSMNDQVANVRNPREGIGKNEDRVPLGKQSVAEQEQRTRQAQPPKRRRHDDAFELFGCIPLNEETREENGVAQPADHLPYAPSDAEKFAVVIEQISERIHGRKGMME